MSDRTGAERADAPRLDVRVRGVLRRREGAADRVPRVRRAEADVKPRCRSCRKALVWQVPRVRFRRLGRIDLQRVSRVRSHEAIRCLDCRGVFCPTCARKHFAPIRRAQLAVDRQLARMAVKLLKQGGVTCKS